MKRRKIALIFIIAFVVIIVGGYLIISKLKGNVQKQDDYQDYVPEQEISEEQYRETIVNLYFLNKENKELIAESRPVDAKILAKDPYKVLVNLLIEGTKSEKLENVIPTGTVVFDASIEGGCVIVNVSKEFLNFGEDEVLKENIINSITKTLCELTEVKNVSFLIEGQENEKIADVYGLT